MDVPQTVDFSDDFTGAAAISGAYLTSISGPASVSKVTLDSCGGGIVQLACFGSGAGTARLHYGGVQSNDGGIDRRDWMMRRDICFATRLFLNSNTNLQATVGFTGTNDPDNVLAAILNTNNNPYWLFQARRKDSGTQYNQLVTSSFIHTPGVWVAFSISLSSLGEPILSANGSEIARVTDLNAVPSTPMVTEWQIWNVPVSSAAYSAPTLWLDWWGARHKRV